MKNGRSITRTCQSCGEPFKEKTRKKECTNCWSKKIKVIAKVTRQRDNEEKKEWQKKIIKTEADTETKEDWDYETFETSTKQKCTTCNDYHYKSESYNHDYTQKKETECIKLTDLTRLLIEYEQEKDLKGTESLRYLNRKGLLKE